MPYFLHVDAVIGRVLEAWNEFSIGVQVYLPKESEDSLAFMYKLSIEEVVKAI